MKSSSSFYILCLDHTGENCPLTFSEHLRFFRIRNDVEDEDEGEGELTREEALSLYESISFTLMISFA